MKLQRFDYQINDNSKKKSYLILLIVIAIMIGGVVIYKSFAKFEVNDTFNVLSGKVGEFSEPEIIIENTYSYESQELLSYKFYDNGNLDITLNENYDGSDLWYDFADGGYMTSGVQNLMLYDYVMQSSEFSDEEKDFFRESSYWFTAYNYRDKKDANEYVIVSSGISESGGLTDFNVACYEPFNAPEGSDFFQIFIDALDDFAFGESSNKMFVSIMNKLVNLLPKFNHVTVDCNGAPLGTNLLLGIDCNTIDIEDTTEIAEAAFSAVRFNTLTLPNSLEKVALAFNYTYAPNASVVFPASSIPSNSYSQLFYYATLNSVTLPSTWSSFDIQKLFIGSDIKELHLPSSFTSIKGWKKQGGVNNNSGSENTTLYLDGPRSATTIIGDYSFKNIIDCQNASLCQ